MTRGEGVRNKLCVCVCCPDCVTQGGAGSVSVYNLSLDGTKKTQVRLVCKCKLTDGGPVTNLDFDSTTSHLQTCDVSGRYIFCKCRVGCCGRGRRGKSELPPECIAANGS